MPNAPAFTLAHYRRLIGRACGYGLATALLCGATSSAQAGAAVGDIAPIFTLQPQSGEPVSLTRFRGRVVYLDFWASWCGPCKESFPWMNEMHAKYSSKGFRVVAVNVDSEAADAQRFLQQNPTIFTVLFDPSGKTPEQFGVNGMPTSYLIDAKGRILMVHPSFKDSDRAELEKHIAAALDAPAEAQ